MENADHQELESYFGRVPIGALLANKSAVSLFGKIKLVFTWFLDLRGNLRNIKQKTFSIFSPIN